ncbi:hypothetical protein [Natrialba aegyptia]|uniref:hypothetical protein n=1 Tax=Natrialba aegyptia TaxID=129789 RepID=UPI000A0310D2|nr:hypothetical protein [Natrialba aegyptia]
MIRRNFLVVVLSFSIGLITILNPIYLNINSGEEYGITYRVDEIENESIAESALLSSEEVLNCPGARECVFEEEVRNEGEIEYNGSIDRGPFYPVVQIEEKVYRPESEIINDTTTFTLQEISNMEAVEYTAISLEDRPSEIKEAVETGSVTVYDEEIEEFEQGRIIEQNGDYYYRTGYSSEGSPWITKKGAFMIQIVLSIIGSILVAYSGWRL